MKSLPALFLLTFLFQSCASSGARPGYPEHWFKPVSEKGAPSWEILPQAAPQGSVILSKRHELGLLSNFAATPFTLDGKKYASVEGFWQMMLFPDPKLKDDPRNSPSVTWPSSREKVAQMVAFDAKSAGKKAEDNMAKLGITWVSFEGEKFPYRPAGNEEKKGRHYQLIVRAMKAKLDQNEKVRAALISTGDLKLLSDHHQEAGAPPAWMYNQIWMELRAELLKP
ncbi:MAG: NADAR family protein [Bdellovibrionales bacterium]|nr:NADAR family protein [Bdellovibrionales bacterium]